MVKITVRLSSDAHLNVEVNDLDILQQLIRERGVVAFMEQVRVAMERIADPTTGEKSEGMKAYFALNGIDEALSDLGQ